MDRQNTFKIIGGLCVIVLVSNLNAIVDSVLHPDIPYFDYEHLIVGGITGIVMAALFGSLMAYIRHLDRAMKAVDRGEKDRQRVIAELKLTFSELETIYNSAPVGLCVFDTQLRFIRINERMAALNGFKVSEHIGRSARALLPGLADQADALLHRVVESGQPVMHIEITGETPAQPGMERHWLESWLPLKDEDGKVVRINVVAVEITEQKKLNRELIKARNELEETVRQRTAQLEATVKVLEKEIADRKDAQTKWRQLSRVFMDSSDPIVIEDLEGRIIEINKEAEKVYGWNRNELIGRSIKSLIPSDSHSQAEQLRKYCIGGKEVLTWETVRQAQHGQIYPVLLTMFQLFDESGNAVAIATFAKDITAIKQVEEELRQSQSRLRELSRKSIDALERDRRSISRELHDSIGASLAAIKLSLESFFDTSVEWPKDNGELCKKIVFNLTHTIKETKRISANLRPLTLDDLGLLGTIDWYTEQLKEPLKNIELIKKIDVGEWQIPDPLKIVIYRILQEALNNAAKHSRADQVSILLTADGTDLVFEIEDNGCGFDFQSISKKGDPLGGFGMLNMQERAEICGGSFSLYSQPGAGTRIRVSFPLDGSGN